MGLSGFGMRGVSVLLVCGLALAACSSNKPSGSWMNGRETITFQSDGSAVVDPGNGGNPIPMTWKPVEDSRFILSVQFGPSMFGCVAQNKLMLRVNGQLVEYHRPGSMTVTITGPMALFEPPEDCTP